jgi:hypothetical protein
MNKTILPQMRSHLLAVYGLFIGCTTIGMIICPRAFVKFFSISQLPAISTSVEHGYYWDVELYAASAVNATCNAFYPLWPWLIRTLFHPQSIVVATSELKFVGAAIFLAILPLFYLLFNRLFKSSQLAFILLLAFALNPTGIMRLLGYTESIYCAIAIFFIYSLQALRSKHHLTTSYIIAIVSTILMSLTRPNSIQIVGAVVATLITLFALKWRDRQEASFTTIYQQFVPELKISACIVASAIVGYCIYGWICLQVRGDFFAPFQDQSAWGRKIGFYPELLFIRASMFEMMALYIPFIILISSVAFVLMRDKFSAILNTIPRSPLANAWLLYPPVFIPFTIVRLKLKSQQIKQEWQSLVTLEIADRHEIETNYLFWFSTYFAVITSTLVFICPTNHGLPSLTSLGRYIFAIPFCYISLGYICMYFNNDRVTRSLYYLILISIISLIEQWVNYGKDLWLC